MAHENSNQEQDQNTAKLVMATFHKLTKNHDGVSAEDITRYLQKKFGDVWRVNKLAGKAEQTLKRSAVLGFLTKQGDYYMENLCREAGCRCRRRKQYGRTLPRKCGRRRPRRRY